jgi:hypothetical protein
MKESSMTIKVRMRSFILLHPCFKLVLFICSIKPPIFRLLRNLSSYLNACPLSLGFALGNECEANMTSKQRLCWRFGRSTHEHARSCRSRNSELVDALVLTGMTSPGVHRGAAENIRPPARGTPSRLLSLGLLQATQNVLERHWDK